MKTSDIVLMLTIGTLATYEAVLKNMIKPENKSFWQAKVLENPWLKYIFGLTAVGFTYAGSNVEKI